MSAPDGCLYSPLVRPLVPHAVAMISTVTMLSGCSFVFVETLPDDHANHPVLTCTSGRASPSLDIAGAIVGGLGGLVALGLVNSLPGVSENQKTWVPVGFFAPAVALTVSGIYGLATTDECRHAIADRSAIPAAATSVTACTYDTQCAGSQICSVNQCADPGAATGTPAR